MWCEQCKDGRHSPYNKSLLITIRPKSTFCEVCAQTSGSDLSFLFEPSFSFRNSLTGLLEGEMGMEKALAPSTMTRGRGCPV